MKKSTFKITQVGLVALLGTLVPAGAIERPNGEKTTEEIPAEPQGGILGKQAEASAEASEVMPVPAEKSAFLGVGGIEASEVLKHQLEFEGGLVLTQVDPKSPAGLAGLAEHDILVSLEDSLLTDQNSLRKALSGFKPGDEVNLKIIRRGKMIDQSVALGANEALALPNAQALIPGQAQDLNQLLRDQLGKQLGGFDNEQLRKQLLEEMERAFGPNGGKDVLEFKLDLKNGQLFNGAEKQLGMQGIGSMRLQDNEGSIEMKMTNGKQILTIRDQDGELLYSGPYDTDIDKAAVPEEFRDRVERLGIGGNGRGGFSLKMENLKRGNEDQKGN